MPARAQVSLLRFLQDSRYRPVGGTRECSSDVRIIAAASPRLRKLLVDGAFRDDLAFRLNVLLLEMPPLRERGGDALLLADHFITRHARHHRVASRPLDAQSREWLGQYAWPGNVRELDNVVQRALLLTDGERLNLSRQAPAQLEASRPVPRPTPPDRDTAAALASFHEARQEAMASFERQYLQILNAGFAVTHDKIVVVDPFSDHCAVVTGSHNLGHRASFNNDENLVIVRGQRSLAAAYATHVLDIYDHFSWRWIVQTQGLQQANAMLEVDPDKWQSRYFDAAGNIVAAQLKFWLGALPLP
jgi:hypothetical protein